MIQATNSPLTWPVGWKRTNRWDRRRAQFNTKARGKVSRSLTISEAVGRVTDALKRMGIPDWNVIISTNLELRRDGLPYSGQREPGDPGAAVYWRESDDTERCIAVDQYDRVADNLAAVAATLEALRAVERHGGAEIMQRSFAGFAALPPPTEPAGINWREVLALDIAEAHGATITKPMVREAYMRLRSRWHPDKGDGDEKEFHRVELAYKAACTELGA